MSIIDIIDFWSNIELGITPEVAWQIVNMFNYETGIDRLKAYYEIIHK